MDIGFYIADLLKNQDEVGLPGFGTFSRSRIPGSFNQHTNAFSPPAQRIIFAASDNQTDSLVDYISRTKKLSQASAEYFVNKFITAISELLKASGTAEIKPLGVFRKENEDLVFEPSAAYDLNSAFYGLKAVPEISNIRKDRPVADHTSQDAPAEEPDFFTEFIKDRDDDDELEEEIAATSPEEDLPVVSRGGRIKLVAIAVIAFLAVMAGLFYFLSPAAKMYADSLFSPNMNTTPALPDPAATTASPVLTDTASAAIPSSGSSVDSAALDSAKAIVLSPPAEVTTYEIIAASFGKKSEADEYVKRMNSRGIPARIVGNIPGNRVKVSVKSFTDEASAQEELNRTLKDNKDAWIYVNKPKKNQ